MSRSMTKWRLLGPSIQLMFDPPSGARAVIRDTCGDGAYRFHWSVIPSEEFLPIAAGRTGGLARARSIAEEALSAYTEDWRGLRGLVHVDTEGVVAAGHERAREGRVEEVDRQGVIQHAARPRWASAPSHLSHNSRRAMPSSDRAERQVLREERRCGCGPGTAAQPLLSLAPSLLPYSSSFVLIDDRTAVSLCPVAWACPEMTLCSRHVWPRPSLLRCQRDQARFLDPTTSADPEHRSQLERGADGPASDGPVRSPGRRAQPGSDALGLGAVLGEGPQSRLRQYQRQG